MLDSNKREDHNLNVAMMEQGEVVLVGTTPEEQGTAVEEEVVGQVRHAMRTGDRNTSQPMELSGDSPDDEESVPVLEEGEVPWAEEPAFRCEKCKKVTLTSQLQNKPSHLKGDTFFRLRCAACTPHGHEEFQRMRLTWQQIVMLAMYNLSLESSGRQGYFRWKEDICAFIDKHWTFLLGDRKQTSTWWSTVAGCLSVGSPALFRSGVPLFGEQGWWKLVNNRPPTMRLDVEKMSSVGTTRAKSLATKHEHLETGAPLEDPQQRAGQAAANPAIELKEKRTCRSEQRRAKCTELGGLESLPARCVSQRTSKELEETDAVASSGKESPPSSPMPSPSPTTGSPRPLSTTPSLFCAADLVPEALPPHALLHGDDEMELMDCTIDPGAECDLKSQACKPIATRQPCHDDQAAASDGGQRGWTRGLVRQDRQSKQCCLEPLSEFGERQLLRVLETRSRNGGLSSRARRLRRKLLVRFEMRRRGHPLFDLDVAVARALGVGLEEAEHTREVHMLPALHQPDGECRVLDRYQTSFPGHWESGEATLCFSQRLAGGDDPTLQPIISPYTTRLLKPYIRREYDIHPPKLRLLRDIRAGARDKDPDAKSPPDAPVDFCYVRLSHIPAANALCQQFFWPGIDLSDCLQYPDFSVVVLYRRLVIGFGCLVPDVRPGEAYISFLLVHPEWRHVGIGTFMIYHLLQTCMGKDVCLHVSASNPAMLLYQRFGFKAEELVLDFYEQYLPPESSECRHAFLLRLRR
uniref:cysteine-rich protein 2-binding protein isoform X2 n=1 Tax=Myxine glutinosa TaxID=7769 RepID=UPI00358F1E8F